MPATIAAANDGGIETTSSGKEAIRKLKSTDPPLYLSPTPDLSESARLASEYLFSFLKPYTPKTPFSQLLVKGFDAEQIWQQIDIQSQPLISSLKRKVRNFEKNPDEIKKLFTGLEKGKPVEVEVNDLSVNGGIDDFEDEDETAFGNDDEEADSDSASEKAEDEGEEEENSGEGEGEEEEDEVEEDEDEEETRPEKSEGVVVKEDEFFKLDELEKYMEMDEAREYGYKIEKKKGKKRGHDDELAEDDEEEHEEGDDEDEDDDELGLTGLDDDDDNHYGKTARAEDLWDVNKVKNTRKRKYKSVRGASDNLKMDEGSSDEDNDQKNAKPSTHEMELEKRRAAYEELQRANMEPKTWTMQGEVTAAKRPKNSALGVDLDFDRNVQPARVITKEYEESLEDMITKKASEHGFDDNEKLPTLPSRAPREVKELDENKSKEGLGDIYEKEYAEKTGLVSVAVSLSEQQKKEAKLLFQELCLKFDALSHFYFTPKPEIQDMSIQNNVPAFAMEEIAPVAVSDAAMLAPEEVFAGKGDIKDETELTQAERKRRRANKKRKFKANEAKKVVKAQPTPKENEAGELP